MAISSKRGVGGGDRLNRWLVIAPILALLFLPTVAGDYVDTFDSYPSGTVSPWSAGNPWTQSTTGTASCTTGTEVDSVLSGAYSQPNVYAFIGANTAGCFSGVSSVELAGTFNYTASPTIKLSFYYYPQTTIGSNSTPWVFTVSVCGNAVTNLVGLDHATQKWYKVSLTEAAASSCSIFLELSSVNGGTPAAVGVYVDNLVVNGANAEFSNANVFLETLNSNTTPKNPGFNITQFSNSYAQINYTNTGAYTIRNLTAPDFYAPLTNAKLLTVYVSGTYRTVNYFYSRSIIPTSTTHQIEYLDDPSAAQVIQYQITVADFSGNYPAGTTAQFYAAGNTGALTLIASGYLDSNHQISEGLVPGVYAIVLTSGSNSFASTVTLVPSVASVLVTVPSITISNPANQQTALTCKAYWSSPTQITAYYNDETDTTTAMTFNLYIVNATGTFAITSPATYSPGPYGSITYAGTDYANLNQQQGASYYLTCTITDTFYGSATVYPNSQGAAVLGGNAGTAASFPDVLNAGAILPGVSNPTTQFGGLSIFLAIAAGFSEFFNPIGALIIGGFGVYLAQAGWLSGSVATIMIIISVLSGIGLLVWLERRSR